MKDNTSPPTTQTLATLTTDIKRWGRELGFQQVGITDANPGEHRDYLDRWLAEGLHGDMEYMASQQALRNDPAQLHENTCRVISLRMDYLPPNVETVTLLDHPEKAYLSRYALGRDYHKLIRKRIAQLGAKIKQTISSASYRPFVDSAPVLERAFAEKAGLGWIGKNTMLINSTAGSWFFLGELFTDIPLPIDQPQQSKHCGSCTACMEVCPTDAFTGPFKLDARKCISYLTIELKDDIPTELRPKIGNRVFGCDDCQLICPWNKFAHATDEKDFKPRHNLDNIELVELFLWTEREFDENTLGSPIRRIGYHRWLRNLAIGLGNSGHSTEHAIVKPHYREKAIAALHAKKAISPMVDRHIEWALTQLHKH